MSTEQTPEPDGVTPPAGSGPDPEEQLEAADVFTVEAEAVVDPPVYDERGNVRPRGTEGARPMSHDERVAIAERLRAEAEQSEKPAPRAGRAAKRRAR